MSDIKLIDVARYYQKLGHQDRALNELDAKLRASHPDLLSEFQEIWRRSDKEAPTIKLIAVTSYYKGIEHQDKALNHLEIKLRGVAPELIEEFQDSWRREPQPEHAAQPKPPVGGRAIVLPTGRVYLHDPIIKGGNFYWSEALHGGTRLPQNKQTVANIVAVARKVQVFRDKLGVPFEITSWFRPEPWNSRARGARFSTHLSGLAVDVIVAGMSGQKARALIGPTWVGGLGTYRHFPNIIHLDAGPNRRW